MKKLNQNGFSAIEAILILVIVALLGGVGWYVWHNRAKTTQESNTTPATTTTPTTSKSTKTAAAPTNACNIVPLAATPDWKTYTSSKYKFSISYPSNWTASVSGGAENNSSHTPILTSLEFVPAGSQGPQYAIEVTGQTLSASIKDWTDSLNEARRNHQGTSYTIVNQKSCKFDGNDAERIDTKQSDTTGTTYDGEFYVAANGYSYKFSTSYGQTSNPFHDSELLKVVESLNVK